MKMKSGHWRLDWNGIHVFVYGNEIDDEMGWAREMRLGLTVGVGNVGVMLLRRRWRLPCMDWLLLLLLLLLHATVKALGVGTAAGLGRVGRGGAVGEKMEEKEERGRGSNNLDRPPRLHTTFTFDDPGPSLLHTGLPSPPPPETLPQR